jgi:hypothetical protein
VRKLRQRARTGSGRSWKKSSCIRKPANSSATRRSKTRSSGRPLPRRTPDAQTLFASPLRGAVRGPILRGCRGWRLGPADRIRRPSGAGHCVICRPLGSGLAKTRRLPPAGMPRDTPSQPVELASSLRSLGLRSPPCSVVPSRRKRSGGAAPGWPPSLDMLSFSAADRTEQKTVAVSTPLPPPRGRNRTYPILQP